MVLCSTSKANLLKKVVVIYLIDKETAFYMIRPIVGRNSNLSVIFEAKLTFERLQVQSPSIVFVGTVDTIFLGKYKDLMFLFRFKK